MEASNSTSCYDISAEGCTLGKERRYCYCNSTSESIALEHSLFDGNKHLNIFDGRSKFLRFIKFIKICIIFIFSAGLLICPEKIDPVFKDCKQDPCKCIASNPKNQTFKTFEEYQNYTLAINIIITTSHLKVSTPVSNTNNLGTNTSLEIIPSRITTSSTVRTMLTSNNHDFDTINVKNTTQKETKQSDTTASLKTTPRMNSENTSQTASTKTTVDEKSEKTFTEITSSPRSDSNPSISTNNVEQESIDLMKLVLPICAVALVVISIIICIVIYTKSKRNIILNRSEQNRSAGSGQSGLDSNNPTNSKFAEILEMEEFTEENDAYGIIGDAQEKSRSTGLNVKQPNNLEKMEKNELYGSLGFEQKSSRKPDININQQTGTFFEDSAEIEEFSVENDVYGTIGQAQQQSMNLKLNTKRLKNVTIQNTTEEIVEENDFYGTVGIPEQQSRNPAQSNVGRQNSVSEIQESSSEENEMYGAVGYSYTNAGNSINIIVEQQNDVKVTNLSYMQEFDEENDCYGFIGYANQQSKCQGANEIKQSGAKFADVAGMEEFSEENDMYGTSRQ